MEKNIITEENQYSFIVWANDLKPPSISAEAFETLLSLHLPDWIAYNRITWISAYTTLIDAVREHASLAEAVKCQSTKEPPPKKDIRPEDPERKRDLLASFFPK